MTEEKLKEATKNSNSIAETLKAMQMSVTTGNYKTFHRLIKKYNIDTSHFLGQGHLKNKQHITVKNRTLESILIQNSDYSSIAALKTKLIKGKLLEYKCSNCNLVDWNEKPISLQLDHINGISNDHRMKNLRLLCPNCHSQTDTFAGRNARKPEVIIGKPNHDYCVCGSEKRKESNICRKCLAHTKEKIKWPSNAQLQTMVNNSGYSTTARTLGVSPTSVRDRLARALYKVFSD